MAEALLRRTLDPNLLLGVEGRDTVEVGVHVAGRDGVDADARVSPLTSERMSEVHDASLGRIVGGLLLRVIDDCGGHGGDVDDGASISIGPHSVSDSLIDVERPDEVDVLDPLEQTRVADVGRDVRAVVR